MFYTINYLSWSQIFFRLYYRVLKLRVDTVAAIEKRSWIKCWDSPAKNAPRSILNLNNVYFLGEPGEINASEDWNCSKKSKLWLYNLHYLDELSSNHASQQTLLLNEFIEKWIHENPPCMGNGWEPYPLSLRLVNLVKWFSRQHIPTPSVVLTSMGLQAQALAKQVEYHIRGNHLFVNGKALIFVGAFLDGSQANRWLKKGLAILDVEIKEQFLKDGAHFELSPMYHASVLWDLCDLVNLADRTGISELVARKTNWRECIEKGLHWLQLMCHPDGEISFFNDSACGIAPSLAELQQYVTQFKYEPPYVECVDNGSTTHSIKQDFSLTWLKESGYCVVHIDEHSKAILDVGKIGPDYQPGHAHADTLSFELSLYGQRVLVNSGTSQYGETVTRQLQRGTKAHNTVIIDNEDSSEVWAGFRVARRAYPKNVLIEDSKKQKIISCTHTGYLRLLGRNLHRREWVFSQHGLTVLDSITGHYNTAEARFYFHPDVYIERQQNDTFKCKLLNEKEMLIRIKLADSVYIEPSTWHPFFGISTENCCLVATFKRQTLLTEIEWRRVG